jgi:hypothetical protein
MRFEGQHAVAAGDHLAMTEVDTVEGSDRHPALRLADVGQTDDPHRREAYWKVT